MGFYATTLEYPKPHQQQTECATKTASRKIFASNRKHVYKIERNPLNLQQEKLPTTYKTASGRPYWPSRDPIEEWGGVNLYAFVENEPVSWWDSYGLRRRGGLPAVTQANARANGRALRNLFNRRAREAEQARRARQRRERDRQRDREIDRQRRLQWGRNITQCLMLYRAYKSLEDECRKCTYESTPMHKELNCACWTGVTSGLTQYLNKRCDYVLPGSINHRLGGSPGRARAHYKKLLRFVRARNKCCKKC